MKKFKCLVIDDEPVARRILKEYIAEFDFLDTIGEASDPIKATNILTSQPVDLIFLDIQMPKVNGIDFLKQSKNLPLVILTTAYSEFALQGYELNVVDYLMKPISIERFSVAILKAKELFELKESGVRNIISNEDFFFIRCNKQYEKIYFKDILFIEAAVNYVSLITGSKKYLTYLTLKNIEEYLPEDEFVKIHKSYMVSIAKIDSVGSEEVIIAGNRLPLSKNYKDVVMDIVTKKTIRRN